MNSVRKSRAEVKFTCLHEDFFSPVDSYIHTVYSIYIYQKKKKPQNIRDINKDTFYQTFLCISKCTQKCVQTRIGCNIYISLMNIMIFTTIFQVIK